MLLPSTAASVHPQLTSPCSLTTKWPGGVVGREGGGAPQPPPPGPHPPPPPFLESFKMLVEALASSECFGFIFFCRRRFLTRFLFFFLFFLSNLSSTNVEVIIFITSLAVSWFFSVRVRVRVCRSTKGCMTVKGWLRCSVFYFYFILKAVSQALLSLLRCFYFSFWWWRSWGGGTLSSASPPLRLLFFVPHVSSFLYLSIY